MSQRRTSDLSVSGVEAELKKYEKMLETDTLDYDHGEGRWKRADSTDWTFEHHDDLVSPDGPRPDVVPGEKEQPTVVPMEDDTLMGVGGSSKRLSKSRRDELIRRLEAEKKARVQYVKGKGESEFRVEKIQPSSTRRTPVGSSSASASSSTTTPMRSGSASGTLDSSSLRDSIPSFGREERDSMVADLLLDALRKRHDTPQSSKRPSAADGKDKRDEEDTQQHQVVSREEKRRHDEHQHRTDKGTADIDDDEGEDADLDDDGDDIVRDSHPTSHLSMTVDEEQRMLRDSDRRELLMDEDDLLDEYEGDSKENSEGRGMSMIDDSEEKKSRRWAEPRSDRSSYGSSSGKKSRSGSGGTPEVLKRKVKNRFSKEQVEKEVQQQLEEQCTFQPKTKTYRSAKSRGLSQDQRLRRLWQDKKEVHRKWEMMKEMKERQEMEKCKFHPEVLTKTKPSLRDHIPLEERLYHDGDGKAIVREQKKIRMEEEELSKCKFQPKIYTKSTRDKWLDPASYAPIHERVGELQKEMAEKQKQKQLEKEKELGVTYAPTLDELSVQMTRDYASRPASERLFAYSKEVHERRSRKLEDVLMSEVRECSFQPQINPQSERIVQEADGFAGANRDFLERQKAWTERKERQRELDALIMEEKAREGKKSKTSKKTEKLMASKRSRVRESEEERFERLSQRDAERLKMMKEKMESQFISQFSFKPKINEISKSIGRASTLDELACDERAKRIREQMKNAAEKSFRQTHTFKPQVSTGKKKGRESGDMSRSGGRESSVSTGSDEDGETPVVDFRHPESIAKRIELDRKKKEEKLEEVRRQLAFEEMRTCTFRPTVKRSKVKSPSGPIVVRGLGKFLERKELARLKEEDQKAREERAFKTKVTGSKRPFTIPKPFHLHADYNSELKKVRLMEDLRMQEMEECTFHPRTTDQQHREAVQRMLAAGDDDDDDDDGEREFHDVEDMEEDDLHGYSSYMESYAASMERGKSSQ